MIYGEIIFIAIAAMIIINGIFIYTISVKVYDEATKYTDDRIEELREELSISCEGDAHD